MEFNLKGMVFIELYPFFMDDNNMNEVDVKDFIKDYTKVVDKEKASIDDLIKEIKYVIKMSPQLNGSSITDDEIRNILQQSFDAEQKQIKLLEDSNKRTDVLSNNIEEYYKTSKPLLPAIVSMTRTMKDIRGVSDLVSYTNNKIDYILGDTKDTLQPLFILNKMLFSSIHTMANKTSDVVSEVKDVLYETQVYDDKILNTNIDNTESIKDSINDAVSYQTDTMRELMPSSVFNDIRDINQEILDTLQTYLGLQKEEWLEEDREEAHSSHIKTLSKAALLGFIAGAIAKKVILPLQIFYNLLLKIPVLGDTISAVINTVIKTYNMIKESLTFGLGKAVKFIRFVATSVGKWATTFEKAEKFIVPVTEAITKTIGYLSKFKKIILILSSKFAMFAAAFKVGFKLFGWPLQLLLSVIDFIKGFKQSAETTLIGKVKDGIKNIIFKFLEFPVYLLGVLFQKIFKTDIGGDEFVEGLRKTIGFILDMITRPFEVVFELTKWFFNKIKDVIISIYEFGQDVYDTVLDIYDDYIAPLIQIIKKPFIAVYEWFQSIVYSVLGIKDEVVEYVENLPIVDKIKNFMSPIVNFFSKIGDFVGKIMKWVSNKLTNIPIIGKLWMNTEQKNEKDRELIDNIKKEILDIQKERNELLEKQKKGKLSHRERRKLQRANRKIEKLQKEEQSLLSDITERTEKETKNKAKQNIKDIFKSGIGVDDWGANKILKPQELKKYSKEELQNILKYGNWEKESEKMIKDAIKASRNTAKKSMEPQKNSMFHKFSIGKGDTTDLIPVDGKYVRYNYNQGQKYVWTPEDIKKMYKDQKAGKEVAFGRNFIPQDEAHLNKMFKQQGNNQSILERLKKDEGYRSGLYRDSLGNWTGGYGTLISSNKNLTKAQAEQLAMKKFGYNPNASKEEKQSIWTKQLNNDMMKAQLGIEKMAKERGVNLSDKQKEILTNMAYNMGIGGVGKFNKMWEALKSGDTEKAAMEMKNSRWSSQVPNRANKLISEMRSTKPVSGESVVDSMIQSKANVQKKSIESQKTLADVINRGMKDMGKSVSSVSDRPIVVSGPERTEPPQPPEDIEAMSILWLNKSYGLG
jgi:lysozyme